MLLCPICAEHWVEGLDHCQACGYPGEPESYDEDWQPEDDDEEDEDDEEEDEPE